MKLYFPRTLVVFAFLFLVSSLSAQDVVWHVENLGFFDNREATSGYTRSQTFFGTRLGAEGGITDGTNSLFAGGYAVKEFGAQGLTAYDWTMYYHYKGKRCTGAFGVFPRRLLQRELPSMFTDDSIRYYQPNFTGVLLQYHGMHGGAELYCNWRSRQTATEREIFEIVTDGAWSLPRSHSAFLAGYDAALTHFSVRRGKTPDKVYDKVMVHPWVGWQATSGGYLPDSLVVQMGMVLSFNRDRTDKIWKTPAGFYADVRVDKRRFSLRNRLYYGAVQLTDYDRYGRQLHQGDTYYCSPFYDRLDISYYMLRYARVECSATASFHFTKGTMDNSQLVQLRMLF